MLGNVALLAAWTLLHLEALRWLVGGLLGTEGPLHLGVAAVLVAILARDVGRDQVLDALRRPARGPWAAWLLAGGLPVALHLFVPGPRSLLGMGLLVSAYGLAGLFVAPETWRRARPAALLAAGILPLAQHLDVLLGLPLRSLTAHVVAALCGGTLATGTVLEVEGRYAHVALPCSGVQSLWSATVVLAAASLAWGRSVGGRWLVGLLGTFAGLSLANALRIAVLVGVDHRLGVPLLAEVLHTPLGLIGFVAALLPMLAWLRSGPTLSAGSGASRPVGVRLPAGGVAALLLVTSLAPRAERVVRPAPVPVLPADWTAIEPGPVEVSFVEGRGGVVRKGAFEVGALRGSAALISSRDWVGQHVPELCHEAGGWTMAGDHPAVLGTTPVRWAPLEREGVEGTALWWFTDGTRVTDDHTVRIAHGLFSDTPWMLVSVVVQGRPSPDDPDLLAVVDALRAAEAPLLTLESR